VCGAERGEGKGEEAKNGRRGERERERREGEEGGGRMRGERGRKEKMRTDDGMK
jgi:hypothetical protein